MDWYCVKTKLGAERAALPCLRDELQVECLLPMVWRVRSRGRVKRATPEPLFPGYLFVRVDLATELRKVMHARGVRGFVRMGTRYPTVADSEIAALSRFCEESRTTSMEPMVGLAEGDQVELLGALHGSVKGSVAALLPARNRVRVLIEFLGRHLSVEVQPGLVIRCDNADV